MSEESAAETTAAEADTIEAEAETQNQPEEVEKMASAEKQAEDGDSSRGGAEEIERCNNWSVSSGDYKENGKTYVAAIKEARAKARTGSSKGKGVSDSVENAVKESGVERFLDKDLEGVLEASFLDSDAGLWAKEIANIAKGFLDVGPEEDPYRKIQEASKHTDLIAVLSPGLGSFPATGRHIEKYTGIPTIRVGRKDERLSDILNYSIKIVGKAPVVIAYSSGYIDVLAHVRENGHDNISMIYCVDTDKGDMERYVSPNKIVYIDTNSPLLGPFEALFGGHSKAPTICPVYTLPKTTVHSSVVVGRDAGFLGDIIRETANTKYHNFGPTTAINSGYLSMPMKNVA